MKDYERVLKLSKLPKIGGFIQKMVQSNYLASDVLIDNYKEYFQILYNYNKKEYKLNAKAFWKIVKFFGENDTNFLAWIRISNFSTDGDNLIKKLRFKS